MAEDLTGVIFGIGVLTLGTVILVVALILAGSFARAKVARREELKLEELTQRYEELAAQVRAHQDTLAADTADIRSRVMEIERMLREVD